MTLSLDSRLTLNDRYTMPQLGLGTYLAFGEDCRSAVRTALEYGYRLIDTARIYDNERQVGAALRDCGLKREEVFITTKLWKSDFGDVRGALLGSLERLGLDYVDLYLLHWPWRGFVDIWKELEKLKQEGLAHSIGVANFRRHHLEALARGGAITVPAVNQIEIHPLNTEEKIQIYCKTHGIALQANSPLGGEGRLIVDDPRLIGMREYYHRSAAQIMLRWALQRGLGVIPKSVRPQRILENSQLFDFELSTGDMETISDMNSGERRNYDPDAIDERPQWMEPRCAP